MRIPCPVCHRDVYASEKGRVAEHQDTIGGPCPLGGRYIKSRSEATDA